MARVRRFVVDSDDVVTCVYCQEGVFATDDMSLHDAMLLHQCNPEEDGLAGNQQDDEFPSEPDPELQV